MPLEGGCAELACTVWSKLQTQLEKTIAMDFDKPLHSGDPDSSRKAKGASVEEFFGLDQTWGPLTDSKSRRRSPASMPWVRR